MIVRMINNSLVLNECDLFTIPLLMTNQDYINIIDMLMILVICFTISSLLFPPKRPSRKKKKKIIHSQDGNP